MHSGHMLREGVRPEIVRDSMGHANIDVTQIVYGPASVEQDVRSPLAIVIHRKQPNPIHEDCRRDRLIAA
jgi:integrase